ncbi:plant intracellular Ras-group-related LRR protein 4-like [Magnolia sinica]|uniref:plant intracellular Ras-group-related LRR protein 4-like n=1 Tax=Magnolia sinica TaxID=86752 RepID=UPI002657C7EC|nr:plant intracellular Ras-group-related LRR protein 4-like [Magnolia sinica]
MGVFLQSTDKVVEEITRINRSLPTRPPLDDIDAAMALIQNVDKEEQSRIEAISKQKKGTNISEELFFVLQEMQKNLAYFQSKEQKREALKLLELENIHTMFDEFVQRAMKCLPSSNNYSTAGHSNGSVSAAPTSSSASTASTSSASFDNFTASSHSYSVKERRRSAELFSRDDSYLKKAKSTFEVDGIRAFADSPHGLSLNPSVKSITDFGGDVEKLSLIKLASLIEVSAKKGTSDLNLQNKLPEKMEWLPDSIGKLSRLVTLDFSENRIVALPSTIGGLSSLVKLDLHSNRLEELPDSIGDLFSLVFLDLRGNQLSTLPITLGKLAHLEELDLSSNRLSSIPDTIGNLISLKKLNIETNDIEELPHSIGHCSCLVELRAEYNRLKALPEAVGRLECLEVLLVRYNNIKALPTTMASMSNLKELDVSFNELESVPESLCLTTSLVKMNLGNNFADLQSLPRCIGNLEMLEELDISNNQIRVLPDTFGMLSKLRVLRVQENPLEVPPRHVAEMGAEAVVSYMAEIVAKRDVRSQPVTAKSRWSQFCCFSRLNERKHGALDYIKA